MSKDTYGHTSMKKMFQDGDAYGVGFDKEREARKKLRLAIIGAGGVAQSKYLPAILRLRTLWEPVELTAISRRDPQHGKKIADLYGCRWYADSQRMLEKEKPDGVLVTGPDELHAEHAMLCLRANIPVLVEKPITRSLTDAEELCRYADAKNLILMTVANKRYSPPYRRAKKLVERGPVNNPALYCGRFNLGYDYVSLLESGTIHLFDLTRYFMGDVAQLSAIGVNKYHRNKADYPVDNVVCSFEFVSGSVGTLYTSSTALSLKPWERVEVYGNKSWLAVEDQNELILYDSEEGPIKLWKPVFPNTLLFDEEFGGFMGVLENFLQAIRGKEKPVVSGWDGYQAYELLLAVQLSLYHKKSVRLPLDPPAADSEQREWFKKAK